MSTSISVPEYTRQNSTAIPPAVSAANSQQAGGNRLGRSPAWRGGAAGSGRRRWCR
ncbi:hypothetical protein [Geodermatophilus maliterrae]|uniref:Uncharacterized protein n=1 Tax=Geodermatophilus maliterrae TaxID=3162531 RepID=A0ABV3XJM0_9ACTN